MEELARGIIRWTASHPEYRTSREEVASYALTADEGLALVDPLLPSGGGREKVLERLDDLVRNAPRVDLLVTIPYHTRSVEELWRRWHERSEVHIWGHGAVRKRLTGSDTPLDEIDVAAPVGPVARAFPIGKPRRQEAPLYFPSHQALAFGDAVVGMPDGTLRVWIEGTVDLTWYRERFLPTLWPLAQLDLVAVLVTHGEAAVGDGRRALHAALEAPPARRYW
jgi:hypothetical protein